MLVSGRVYPIGDILLAMSNYRNCQVSVKSFVIGPNRSSFFPSGVKLPPSAFGGISGCRVLFDHGAQCMLVAPKTH